MTLGSVHLRGETGTRRRRSCREMNHPPLGNKMRRLVSQPGEGEREVGVGGRMSGGHEVKGWVWEGWRVGVVEQLSTSGPSG